jgi:diaminopimelate epimerase
MRLTKHHALANDFLVVLDGPAGPDLARRLCHRRTGIGADGLIRADTSRSGAIVMELWNADGNRAEMSGNGIRCLAQALVDAGVVTEGEVVVTTDAGERWVRIGPEDAPGTRTVTVDMGAADGTVDDDAHATVSMGNPHTVLRVDALETLPPGHDDATRNVEFVVAGPEADAVSMRVIERGVGETQACGTGACAAAWAANRWGLVGDVVTVHQPGGDALVELKPDTILLTGPTTRIAAVHVDEAEDPAQG